MLREIERAAGEPFRSLGMDVVADDAPPSPELVRSFIGARRAWVIDDGQEVAAYLLADVVDGCAYVEQVSVHPRHARRRYGARLVERLVGWAHEHDLPAITLTTYRHVPWNGPYYETLGFRWLLDDELSSELRTLRVEEAERGLDRWPRGCMRRALRVDADVDPSSTAMS